MMGRAVLDGALVLGILGCGAMAGLYYAFSGFILRALDATGPDPATAAMVAINRVILQSSFMGLFFGSCLLSVGLLMAALILRPAGFGLIAAGAAVYLIGMLAVTVLRNVPLNDMLALRGTESWPLYMRSWGCWNHIRAASSLIGATLFCLSLLNRA
ncbi:DUF1772 domain-containing protein [Paracoccus sp. S1E-3]|uniref:anthrone oxygenase family protein n=1 Tax=Paracoccus sp. S1E-3 TaxID=2756130 RepID=UPI0015EF34FE|nr:anthrone oxygenase family protein [Paracoccus sp. S1E-3]MBA4491106.1 DUF1772 domain-containing protein [Paracoccus sp. S1E-3]